MTTNEMLALRLNGYSYAYIGKQAGISRQRVQQILSPPSQIRNFVVRKYNGKCADCALYVGATGHVHHKGNNGEDYHDIENLELLCIACHRKRHTIENNNKCLLVNKGLYSAKEAKEQLEISKSYIYLLVGMHKLTPARTGPLMFTAEEIARYKNHSKGIKC